MAADFTVDYSKGKIFFKPDGSNTYTEFIPKGGCLLSGIINTSSSVSGYTENITANGITKSRARVLKEAWNANIVRVSYRVRRRPGGSPLDGFSPYSSYGVFDQMVQNLTSLGIVVMFCAHDTAGTSADIQYYTSSTNPSLAELGTFVRELATRYKDNPFVWFDIANECGWDTANPTAWGNMYRTCINEIRNTAGARNIIVCEDWYYGQAKDTGNTFADSESAVFSVLPGIRTSNGRTYENLAASIHTYQKWESSQETRIRNYWARCKQLGFPLIVGEYNYKVFGTTTSIEAMARTLDVAQPEKFGRLTWAFEGSGNNMTATSANAFGINRIDGVKPSNLTNSSTNPGGNWCWNDLHGLTRGGASYTETLETYSTGSTGTQAVLTVNTPTPGQVFGVGETVVLSSTVSSLPTGVTVSRVEYLNGNTVIGQGSLNGGNYVLSTTQPTTPLNNDYGDVNLVARATLSNGNALQSPLTISVAPNIPSDTRVPSFNDTKAVVWESIPSFVLGSANIVGGAISNTTDLSINLKVYYTTSTIYFLASITDDIAQASVATSSTGDSIEFYIRGVGTTVDNQFRIAMADGSFIETKRGVVTGVQSKLRVVSSTVREIEFGVPRSLVGITSELVPGQTQFVEFQYNDSDTASIRDAKLVWLGSVDNAFQSASNYKPIKLIAGVTTPPPPPPPPPLSVDTRPAPVFPQPYPGNFSGHNFGRLQTAGGGWFTKIIQDKFGNFYAGSDIGGLYRFDESTSTWEDCFATFPYNNGGQYLFGVESVATDKNGAIYAACGKTAGSTSTFGVIKKSINGGKTWLNLGLSNVRMGGNDEGRYSGEILAVDPFEPNHVIFASRKDGLWLADNGGYYPDQWVKNTSIPAPDNVNDASLNKGAFSAVLFDPYVRGLVYCAIYEGDYYNATKAGIYSSVDGGVTWTKIAGQPTVLTKSNRMTVLFDGVTGSNPVQGTLIVTHEAGVSKYTGGAWTDYTYNTISNTTTGTRAFNAVAACPYNPQEFLVSTYFNSGTSQEIFRTINKGTSWTKITYNITSTAPHQISPNGYGWGNTATAAITYDNRGALDTTKQRQVWMVNFYSAYRCVDITATSPVSFVGQSKGLANAVCLGLHCPPPAASGQQPVPVLAGFNDIGGFAFDNAYSEFPSKYINGPWERANQYNRVCGDIRSFDSCYTSPLNIVWVGLQRAGSFKGCKGGISTDGGRNWNPFTAFPTGIVFDNGATTPANKLVAVAYSASTVGVYMVSRSDTFPYLTANNSTSWISHTGGVVPEADTTATYTITKNLAADKVDGTKFYYRPDNTTKLYTGTWNGSTTTPSFTWALTNPALAIPADALFGLFTAPGTTSSDIFYYQTGHGSISSDTGLYRSTNGGTSFTKVPGLDRVVVGGVGKKESSSSANYTIFVYGIVGGVWGLFRSIDNGTTWVKTSSPLLAFGNQPQAMVGNMQTFGDSFIGGVGSSVYYSQLIQGLYGAIAAVTYPAANDVIYE